MTAVAHVNELEHASKTIRLTRLEREAWQDLYGRLCVAVEAAQGNVGNSRIAITELLSAFAHASRGLTKARQNEERASHALSRLFPSVS